jgi:phosphotriesterase-related protein
MKNVETVLGPVPADQLGFILPHEHLLVDTYDVRRSAEGVLLELSTMSDEVADYKAAGGNTIVDQTIYGLHPDPNGLAEISKATGVHIIAGTGFYHQQYYPEWLDDWSVTQIADRMLGHIVDGFPGTNIKAGIMGELGTHHRGVKANERKVLEAAAKVQAETKRPIGTHALFTEVGIEQLNILEEAGADLDITLIGHCDTNRDIEYSRKLLKRGVWIGYDAVGQLDKQRDELRAQTIATLISEGYLEKILISTDIAARARLKIHGNEGYKFLITKFLPLLRSAGVTDDQINTLTRKNPQRFLAGK